MPGFALLCCTVCDGAGTALHASGKVRTGWEVFSATRSGPQCTQGSDTCTCGHTHPQQGGSGNQAAPHPGRGTLSSTQSPMGNSSGWAEPLYLFTGYLLYLLTEYLEYFCNLNCTGQRISPLNCDQPDCRQNSKHSPTLGSMCKVVLPHSSRPV